MAKTARQKNITLRSENSKGLRLFAICLSVFAFVVLYFTLALAVEASAVRLTSVLVGVGVATVIAVFDKHKYVKWIVVGVVALYALLVVTAGYDLFRNGFLDYCNDAVAKANFTLHYGWKSFACSSSSGAEFLFSSVVSAALAVATVFAVKKDGIYIGSAFALVFVLLCLGLYPEIWVVALLVAACIGLLAVEHGFTLKAIACYAGCSIVLFGAIAPCYIYSGSVAVEEFRDSVVSAAESMVYGSDGLPEGDLSVAEKMNIGSEARLEVTLSNHITTLYLKGFVGNTLDGKKWKPTDKNVYVSNGYQGLIEYVSEAGIPFTQYSRYSALNIDIHSHEVTVKNIGANGKYTYTPYTISSETGEPYYDLNLRGGGEVYSYTVFSGDESRERITQELWLTENSDRTPSKNRYIEVESEYRAFVYDVYSGISDGLRSEIVDVLKQPEARSINTVTQCLRALFSDAYSYSQTPDEVKSDFLHEFFNGDIALCNSAYFASAATYVFRAFGFAARYAEGYLLSSEIEDDDLSADRTVLLTDKDAHAWTEVYFDGIGWLPIEVTPTFFSDQELDTVIDPEDPEMPSTQVPSIDPDVPVETPTDPLPPPVETENPQTPVAENNSLLYALKAIVPISAVALGMIVILLSVVLRRELVLQRKRNKLKVGGEDYGRAAYSIVNGDCKRIGGVNVEALAKLGIEKERTARFMQIIERSVYGGYDLNINEKQFVENYIDGVSTALMQCKNKLRKIYLKYIRCVGI